MEEDNDNRGTQLLCGNWKSKRKNIEQKVCLFFISSVNIAQ